LPLKLDAVTVPFADIPPLTFTLPLDWDIMELPNVELLTHTGMVPAVPLPCTACTWAAAAVAQLRMPLIAATRIQSFVVLRSWCAALAYVIRIMVTPHFSGLRIHDPPLFRYAKTE
jgi:hypothetical protein